MNNQKKNSNDLYFSKALNYNRGACFGQLCNPEGDRQEDTNLLLKFAGIK